jgi:hypothetical protein
MEARRRKRWDMALAPEKGWASGWKLERGDGAWRKMMCEGVMRVDGAMRVTGRSSIWESLELDLDLELALCFAVALLRRATFLALEAVDLGAMLKPMFEKLSLRSRARNARQNNSKWSFVHLKAESSKTRKEEV